MPWDLALYLGHSGRQSMWVKPTDASLPGVKRGHVLLPCSVFHNLAGLWPRGIVYLHACMPWVHVCLPGRAWQLGGGFFLSDGTVSPPLPVPLGAALLDLEQTTLPGIAHLVVETMIVSDQIRPEDRASVLRTLLLKHRCQGGVPRRGPPGSAVPPGSQALLCVFSAYS